MHNIDSYINAKEHSLISLLKPYEPIALMYYMPHIPFVVKGLREDMNLGIWLTNDTPHAEYFEHMLKISYLIDEAYGPAKYRPIILNLASYEIRRMFVRYGSMIFARYELDRLGFMVSANEKVSKPDDLISYDKENILALGNKIIKFTGQSILRRGVGRKGMLIDFRPPPVRL